MIQASKLMIQRGLIPLLLLVAITTAKGQGETPPTSEINVIPPSPNAASLGKYGDYEFGSGTGKPNINVPIYNFKCGSLTVPINLNHDASAVKVESIASWVGTGWSLNVGGVITRTVRGKPDESLNGYNKRGVELPTTLDPTDDNDYSYLELVASGAIDAQPDVFFFNFNGKTGKFYIDYQDQIILVPHQGIEILEHPFDANSQSFPYKQRWVIVDEMGIKYTFGGIGQEITGAYNIQGVEVSEYDIKGTGENHVSSWYLTSIVSPQGDEIYFSYDPTGISYYTRSGETVYSSTYGGSNFDKQISELQYEVMGLTKLKEIDYKTQKVVFHSNTLRNDLANDTRLDSIEIYDLNDVKFSYELQYEDVAYGSGPIGNIPSPDNETGRHRLFLTKMIKKMSNSEPEEVYTFTYDRKEQLPHRYSYSQDHWGYYNGANNSTMIPDVVSNPAVTFTGISSFADREPNINYSTMGALTSIQYPTGGKAEFVYGSNRYSSTSQGPVEHYEISSGVYGAVARNIAGLNHPLISQTIDFDVDQGQNVDYHIWLERTTDTYNCDTEPNPEPQIGEGSLSVTLYNSSSTQIFLQEMNAFGCNSIDGSIYLSSGSYQLVLTTIDNTNYQKAIARLKITQESDINTYCTEGECGSLLGGGIRVDTIKYFDNLGSGPASIKAYEYMLDANTSSGKMLGVPRYHSTFQELVMHPRIENATDPGGVCEAPQYTKTYLVLSSKSQAQLGSFSGSDVFYSKIAEYTLDGSGSSNGRVEKFFSYAVPSLFFGKVVNDYNYRNGQLTNQKVYKENDDMVSSMEVTMDYTKYASSLAKIKGLFVERNYSLDKPGLCITNDLKANAFSWQPFEYLTEWGFTKQVTNKFWVGQNVVTTSTEYDYDNFEHLQLTYSKQIDSNGDIKESFITYPDDYSSGLSEISTLEGKHIQAIPIKKEETVNGKLINGQVRRYNAYGQITEMYNYESDALNNPVAHNPAQIIPSGDYKLRKTFAYDNTYKKVIEEVGIDDIKVVYLWGYNYTYPVAKIVNSDYNTVVATITGGIQAIQSMDGDQLRNALDAIRTGLSGSPAQVSTYTYDPIIGLTSQTDLNGVTTYYEYDDFGRLTKIKDNEDRVLKTYEYNYQLNAN